MSQFPDLDVLKEIPGYQAILKAVLKSQIQLLVEQLSSQTGEESVILTASVTDGTLCHLGSDSGKVFLDDHEDFKSQFLGFCLKRHHKRKAEEDTVQRSNFDPGSYPMGKRRRTPDPYSPTTTTPVHPVSLQKIGSARSVGGHRRPPSHTETSPIHTSLPSNFNQSQYPFTDSSTTNTTFKQESDSSIGDLSAQQTNNPSEKGSSLDQSETNEGGDKSIVKTEPSEDELEITGVELSNMSEGSQSGFDQSQWPQGMGYGAATAGAEGTSYDDEDQAYSNRTAGLSSVTHGDHRFVEPGIPAVKSRPGHAHKLHQHQCSYCGKSFQRKHDLIRHVRTHTGEKPFKCSVCERMFSDKSNMRAHYAKHIMGDLYKPQKQLIGDS